MTTCAGDCDDADPAIHPGASQICGDGIDQTCEVTEGPIDDPCASADLDGDGWPATPAGTDCDDRDAGVHPGARERCGDGVDQDCQQGDLACSPTDEDGDGHGSQAQGGADCDDGDRRTYPGAPDKCGDGVDQDCDGHDPECGEDRDGDGYLAGAGDCDDDDRTVFPWTTERCNGQDDDCDGEVDEGNPLSLRGEASPSNDCYDGPQDTEGVGACRSGARICTRPEGASVLICLGQVLPRPETCDNEGDDDDCSGSIEADELHRVMNEALQNRSQKIFLSVAAGIATIGVIAYLFRKEGRAAVVEELSTPGPSITTRANFRSSWSNHL